MDYAEKIISYDRLEHLHTSLSKKRNDVTIVGGCFDILHIGHIRFLHEAKEGATLVVLLESDVRVKELKGSIRPYFSQKERAEMLAALSCVDYVILLPVSIHDRDYARFIQSLKPTTIAVTAHDVNIEKKRVHAQNVGAAIKIIPLVKTASTSKVAKLLGIE